ncbi:neutral zinc metallopeptidase [Sedimentimonas flavescens]|uniref:Neutral zinc metallopeptidase n=1 Tax=Sedimentimonas flavescens TaxID=2851012 RepID=A0ABT2ZXF2_9RHOB|nr:neutral zinc metallopeptidase [Sedimentimonas flavescens]MBW0157193.1 neutral zinc metallopeptidase [Sedimentimonas flavescens]MCT2538460.1 neutral zinc metallopeptidase [Sedimentimonas flavescens]MCV2878429.1 neutral zinc metallopeptidase [Sedimentimonas flavescens]
MKWQGRRGSANIEDRRGSTVRGVGRVTGLGAVAILLLGYFLGVDVTPLLDQGPAYETSGELTAQDRAMGDFVSVTLADTEEVWANIFTNDLGREYQPVTLVLYSRVTPSACGNASGATGPFYCPVDKKVYLDTDFFNTLSSQLGAGGDFAAAYVVAHEVAHYVQDKLGILDQVNAVRARSSEAQSNALSVRIELQADCFSGIWARQAAEQFGSIEKGDIAEAMNAAAKIGDDTLQRNAGRRPMPDSFTHGTSEQRQRWFATGFDKGDLRACDTFASRNL